MAALAVSVRPAAAAPGTVDRSFGSGGTASFHVGNPGAGDIAAAAVVQPDLKVVAVGTATYSGSSSVAVARVNRDGALDTSFGNGGTTTVSFQGLDRGGAVAVQPDGKILVGGSSPKPLNLNPFELGNKQFVVARLNRDGSLDTSFGTGGKAAVELPGNVAEVSAIALAPDGTIVVAGRANLAPGARTRFALAKLNPDGSRYTFFFTGKTNPPVTVDFGADAAATSLKIFPDGMILVGGFVATPTGDKLALARVDQYGSFDTGFGTDGQEVIDLGGSTRVGALRLERGGEIDVVALAGSRTAVTRLHPDGTLASTFGVRYSPLLPGLAAVAFDPAGRITGSGSTSNGFTAWRLSAGGRLDASFGHAGAVTATLTGTDPRLSSVIPQANGKIVVVGTVGASGRTDFALARFLGGTAHAARRHHRHLTR
jgi:uncharacterized delta-60 repeat protein